MAKQIKVEHVCTKEKELAEMHVMLTELHRELMGNGQPGLLKEWQQTKGAISTLKWVVGGSGLVGVISLVLHIL